MLFILYYKIMHSVGKKLLNIYAVYMSDAVVKQSE